MRSRSLRSPSPWPGRRSGPARRAAARRTRSPSAAASVSAVSTRAWKRAAAARSASSGSTFSRRATLTDAKRTSPTSPDVALVGLGLRPADPRSGSSCRSSSISSARSANAPRGVRVLEPDRGRATLHLLRQEQRGRASAGRRGRSPRGPPASSSAPPTAPSRRRASRRVERRRRRADAGERASSWIPRATVARSPAPRSSSSSARKYGLEEEVAELVDELRVVARQRGVRDFVRLLDRVGDDRAARSARDPRGSRGGAVRPASGDRRARGPVRPRRPAYPVVAPVVVSPVPVARSSAARSPRRTRPGSTSSAALEPLVDGLVLLLLGTVSVDRTSRRRRSA